MRTQHPAQHSMTFLATACVAAAALLTGCSSSGGGSGINPRPNGGGGTEAQVTPGPKSPQGSEPTPTAEVAHGAAHTVVAAGDAIHRAVVERLQRDRRMHVLGQHPAVAAGDGQ